jgi:formylglycine-generating enzyme required for sulfatase activity
MGRMVFRKDAGAAPGEPDGDAIAWDYGDDAVAFQRPRNSAPSAGTAMKADARTVAVQRALNHALDEWWRRGVLPSNDLLRDGLLVLQAGHDLDESQRTLLLRTALVRRRGVLTALRHQTDPERTAVVLEEAILSPTQPLSAEEILKLQQGDEHSVEWTPILVELLRRTADTDPMRRNLAAPALAVLTNTPTAAVALPQAAMASAPWIESEAIGRRGGAWLRAALVVALLTIAALALFWWQRTQPPADMVDVPASQYLVSTWPDGEATPVELAAFRIDRFEATVARYRACYERGACPWPASPASATRPNYLLDRAFADFPMVNIDYDSADRFCRFMGKRLPTAAEWEVAAAFAPASGRMFRFPWGDEFGVQFANSAATGVGDTMQVGSFRPAGDSSLGVSDMAGNVAEWTATVVQEEQPLTLVKGGSFADNADALRTTAAVAVAPRTAAPWLGVRCVVDVR